MNCKECGTEAPEGSIFCAQCGARIVDEVRSSGRPEAGAEGAGPGVTGEAVETEGVAAVKSDMFQFPDLSSAKVARVYPGDRLRILGDEKGFYQASLETGFSKGRTGYVEKPVLSQSASGGEAAEPRFVPQYGAREDVIETRSPRNPGLALVLSLLWSGVGQIYNGEVGKGIALLVLYVFSLLLIFVVIGIFTTPIIWIYGMVDAYKTAEKLNQNIVGPQKRCPYCAEVIQAQASVCRFCGRDLSTVAASQNATQYPGPREVVDSHAGIRDNAQK